MYSGQYCLVIYWPIKAMGTWFFICFDNGITTIGQPAFVWTSPDLSSIKPWESLNLSEFSFFLPRPAEKLISYHDFVNMVLDEISKIMKHLYRSLFRHIFSLIPWYNALEKYQLSITSNYQIFSRIILLTPAVIQCCKMSLIYFIIVFCHVKSSKLYCVIGWRLRTVYPIEYTENKRSSIWQLGHHWWHCK